MDAFALITELVRDEGIKLKPYHDNADPPRLTIGIGRNLDDTGITPEEAYRLCHNDIERACAALDTRLPWWRGLSEVRQRVLANMTFNMGIERLLKFNNMLAACQLGDFQRAKHEMLASRWASQVGPRAVRLADMMERGL